MDLNKALLVSLLFLVGACGGASGAFSSKFPDNKEGQLETLLQRIQAAPPRPEHSVAAGIGASGDVLFAYDLSSRKLAWQTPVKPKYSPILAGEVVVLQEQDAIVGRELSSGKERFRIDAGDMTLNGADGEGPLVALVLTKGLGTFAESQAILMRGSSRAWSRKVQRQAGVPAVVGNMVLVPWSNQFLSAIDTKSGDELARIRVGDGVISHVLRDRGKVYAGSQHGLARVTAALAGSIRGGSYYTPPRQTLPGRPLFLRDAYKSSPVIPPASAAHRIRLDWQPTITGETTVAFENDSLYLVFYRFIMALDPKDYTLRWAYSHSSDLVGAAAQPGGLAFADQTGSFGLVGAQSGKLVWQAAAGVAASAVRLPASGAGVDGGGEAPSAEQRRGQLLAAAQDSDARLVPARLLAVEYLAALPDAEATSNLLQLCDDSRTAPPVRKAACDSLKDRKIGAEHLMTALERHAAYLEGTSAPPVGALAKAAANLKETRAVPLLIAHLNDPNTRSQDLAALVTALRDLGDRSAAEPLGNFLRLYHADTVDEHLLQALEVIPEALVHLSGPVASPVLEDVAHDELGALSVRERARISLGVLQAQTEAAEKSDEQTQQDEEQEAAAAPTTETEGVSDFAPTHLTSALIKQALLPVRDKLSACLATTKKATYQARVVLVIEEGEALMISVLPKELQDCVEPLIAGTSFPKTKNIKRERMTHVIKRQ